MSYSIWESGGEMTLNEISIRDMTFGISLLQTWPSKMCYSKNTLNGRTTPIYDEINCSQLALHGSEFYELPFYCFYKV